MGLMKALQRFTDPQMIPRLSVQLKENVCWMMLNLFRYISIVRIDIVEPLLPGLKYFIRHSDTKVNFTLQNCKEIFAIFYVSGRF